METKISKEVLVHLELDSSNKDVLKFDFTNQYYIIDINSEDQTKLRIIFTEIIEKLFNEKSPFSFKLNKSDSYDNKLFEEIATEYLKQLNSEIEKIFLELPKFDNVD